MRTYCREQETLLSTLWWPIWEGNPKRGFMYAYGELPWWLRWFNPWVRKIPWRRKWHPTLVLLPGKSHGWRSLVGYSWWGVKESDMTEWLHFTLCIHIADPLCYTVETDIAVQSNFTPIKKKEVLVTAGSLEECAFSFTIWLILGIH